MSDKSINQFGEQQLELQTRRVHGPLYDQPWDRGLREGLEISVKGGEDILFEKVVWAGLFYNIRLKRARRMARQLMQDEESTTVPDLAESQSAA